MRAGRIPGGRALCVYSRAVCLVNGVRAFFRAGIDLGRSPGKAPRILRLKARKLASRGKKAGQRPHGLCPALFPWKSRDADGSAYFTAFKMDCAETVARGLPSTTTAGRLLMP